MGGCSIVFLTIIMMPAMMLIAVVGVVVLAAAEFVMSPAFPCLLVSMTCSIAAIIDMARILWHRYREGPAFELTKRVFVRPLILCVVAAAFFAATLAISGSMLYEFYTSVSNA